MLFLNSGSNRVLALDDKGRVVRESGAIAGLKPRRRFIGLSASAIHKPRFRRVASSRGKICPSMKVAKARALALACRPVGYNANLDRESAKIIQKHLRRFEVSRLEPFGKPGDDRLEKFLCIS